MVEQAVAQHPDAYVRKHQGMIEELIVLTLRGGLDAELATLSEMIPAAELAAVKQELLRLCAPCHRDIDLTHRTNLSIEPFDFGPCTIGVCKVGRQLFEEQLRRFDGQYTQGVYEAVNDPARFSLHMARHREEWKKEAFTVPAGRLHSPIKPSELKLAPNLTLRLPIDGKETAEARCFSLTPYELVLESSQPLPAEKGELYQIEFPGLPGQVFQKKTACYKALEVKHDALQDAYLTRFGILKKEIAWAKTINEYVTTLGHKIPAILPQETVRTDVDLAKVQLMASSEWIPVFCTLNQGQLHPLDVLYTDGNEAEIAALSLNQEFIFSGSWIGRLSSELLAHGEAELFWLRRGGDTFVCTLREASEEDVLESFINQESLRGDLQILKCRLVKLTKQDHAIVRREIKGASEVLGGHLNSILYIKDMSGLRRRLQLKHTVKTPPPPAKFRQSDASAKPVQLLMSQQSERRQEPRYRFGCRATLRAGLLNKLNGTLVDFSLGGMKVELDQALKNPNLTSVHANIDAFRLRRAKMGGIKFEVLGYSKGPNSLRLKVTEKHREAYAKHMGKLFEHNAPVFASRNIHDGHRIRYKSLFALASLRHPGVYVRLKNARFESERLVQALVGEPFTDASLLQTDGGNGLMLHRLFSDKDSETPSSGLLSQLFRSATKSNLYLYAVCLKTRNLERIHLDKLDDARRLQLLAAIGKRIRLVGLWMAVKPLHSISGETISEVMHRMSQISSESAAKAKKELLSVKEVLTLTDVSPLVHCFLHMGQITDNLSTDPAEESAQQDSE